MAVWELQEACRCCLCVVCMCCVCVLFVCAVVCVLFVYYHLFTTTTIFSPPPLPSLYHHDYHLLTTTTTTFSQAPRHEVLWSARGSVATAARAVVGPSLEPQDPSLPASPVQNPLLPRPHLHRGTTQGHHSRLACLPGD